MGQALYLMPVSFARVVSVGARFVLTSGPHVVTLRYSLPEEDPLFRAGLLR